jgi:Family of unknown function (DUF5681)
MSAGRHDLFRFRVDEKRAARAGKLCRLPWQSRPPALPRQRHLDCMQPSGECSPAELRSAQIATSQPADAATQVGRVDADACRAPAEGVFIMADTPSNRQDGSQVSNEPAASGTSTQPTLARLPNGKWPPGVSGNPQGRKPKTPYDDLDGRSVVQQALDKKVTLKEGGKKRRISFGPVILEQWINQAAQGDRTSRRDFLAYCDNHGIDPFAGQHARIRQAAAQGAISSSTMMLSEEVLDRLDQTVLEAIKRAIKEVEACSLGTHPADSMECRPL